MATRKWKPGAGQQSMFPLFTPHIPTAPGAPIAPRPKGVTRVKSPSATPPAAIARGAQGMHQLVAYSANQRKPFPEIDPTRTTNPTRPRTIQAGYDKKPSEATGVLRVRFRDGTPWEYYGVEPQVWQRFRRSASPGKFINRVLNSYPYGPGNF